MRLQGLAFSVCLLAGCASPTGAPAPLSTSPATSVVAETTTTARPELPVVVEDCTAPQIGFAPLCQAYALLQEWHVDRPVDPSLLAGAALGGLGDYRAEHAEPSPRTLFCAVPHPSFSSWCEELARRMTEEGLPVGPAVEAALVAMGEEALGPFTYYLPPDMVGAFRANGVVEGVGILIDATDAAGSRCARVAPACPLRIVAVLDGGPGADAGLVPGDRILAVDGRPVDGAGFVETAARIAGDATGEVELTLEREEQNVIVVVERGPLPIPTVEIDLPAADVGYIRIPDFEADIPDLVIEGMGELLRASPSRLVVDLRDNPGGLIDALLPVAGQFLDGVVLETWAPGGSVAYETVGGPATQAELAVLVNRGTTSAAEVLAAALRDQRGARIVGEATFGKDVLQIPFELDNGGELHVAVARWRSPSGSTVAGTGVVPDRSVDLAPTMSTGELASVAFE